MTPTPEPTMADLLRELRELRQRVEALEAANWARLRSSRDEYRAGQDFVPYVPWPPPKGQGSAT